MLQLINLYLFCKRQLGVYFVFNEMSQRPSKISTSRKLNIILYAGGDRNNYYYPHHIHK